MAVIYIPHESFEAHFNACSSKKCTFLGYEIFSYSLYLAGKSLWQRLGPRVTDPNKFSPCCREGHEVRLLSVRLIENNKDQLKLLVATFIEVEMTKSGNKGANQ